METHRLVGESKVILGSIYSIELEADEIVELAIWMERTAVEYYRSMAEIADDEEIKSFFLRLMGMEMNHEKELQSVLVELRGKKVDYMGLETGVSGREFLKMLRKKAQKKIFPKGYEVDEGIDCVDSCDEGLRMALDAERKGYHLYQHLLKFKLYDDARKIVRQLMNDELSHITEIRQIMEKRGTAV